MEINTLIGHLERMRNKHGVTEVRIPRLGYHKCHPINEEEFDEAFIRDGVLAIEGEFDYDNPESMRPI